MLVVGRGCATSAPGRELYAIGSNPEGAAPRRHPRRTAACSPRSCSPARSPASPACCSPPASARSTRPPAPATSWPSSPPPSSAASPSSAAPARSTAPRSARCCWARSRSSLIVLRGQRVLAAGRSARCCCSRSPSTGWSPSASTRALRRRSAHRALRRPPRQPRPDPPPPTPAAPGDAPARAARPLGDAARRRCWSSCDRRPGDLARVPHHRLVHHRLARLLRGRADRAAAHAGHHRGRDRPLRRVGARALERGDGVPVEPRPADRADHPALPRRRRAVRRVQRPARHAPRAAVAGRHDRHARAVPRPGLRRHRRRVGDRLPERLDRPRVRQLRRHAVPNTIVLFAVLAVAFGCCCTARRSAARSSRSAPTRRPRTSPACASSGSSWLFVLSGTVAALAGIVISLRNSTAAANVGQGFELTVVAAVLLGGVSIFGGRGNRSASSSRCSCSAASRRRCCSTSHLVVLDPDRHRHAADRLGPRPEPRPPRRAKRGAGALTSTSWRRVNDHVSTSARACALLFAALALLAALVARRVRLDEGRQSVVEQRPASPSVRRGAADPSGDDQGGPEDASPSRSSSATRTRSSSTPASTRRSRSSAGSNRISGPTDASASSQVPIINAAVQQKPDAIIIAGNDPERRRPGAQAGGPARHQGRRHGLRHRARRAQRLRQPGHDGARRQHQVELIAKQIGNKGEIAILSATPNATNQNAWIKFMKDDAQGARSTRTSSSSRPPTATTTTRSPSRRPRA